MIHLLALLGVIAISFSAVFVRLAGVSPVTATFFRTAYALPVLLAGWLAVRHRDTRTRRERLLAFAAGFILAVDLSLWHRTIDLLGVGLSTVVTNVQVVFVGLAAWLWHKERPSRLAFPMIAVVLAGVVLISGLDRPGAYGRDPVAGALTGALAGVSYAAFLLVFRQSNRRLAPAFGPLFDATLAAAAGALLFSPLDPGFSLAIVWPAHGWLLALALVSQAGGWSLIATALPRLPALETSVLLLVQPVGAVCWGLLFFGEDLSWLQWTGVSLVLAGVATLTIHGSVSRVRASNREALAATGTVTG
ncbi:MAG TPA: DMT family transporter [Vicinamibacterales bacterium]|nr:DMT family transporter [Vicinamibacterales bacterium]